MTVNLYLVFDRNVVGLILLIYKEGEVISTDMKKVNRNYGTIKPVADKLLKAGILKNRKSTKHSTKVIWELTEYGKEIAVHLLEAEKRLNV